MTSSYHPTWQSGSIIEVNAIVQKRFLETENNNGFPILLAIYSRIGIGPIMNGDWGGL